ncbi:MAG: 4-(cytidine 5'-diphospho)-2-C-methyl-D-erythritol kinase [Bacteroidia bacterium]|nr:4-(cytidine 5'-diphospho)-2-C-methyl-D-erythritol kinase [Bacteroidia bacterium]
MIVFSNSKINLGLWVLNKRPDGYHNISTIFYPIHWCDVLEIIPDYSTRNNIHIETFGIPLKIPSHQNIIHQSYLLLLNRYKTLPAIKVFLYKNVPFGAGLGAGSANAAYFIKTCSNILNLNMDVEEMKLLCSQIGSDCSFFIDNTPALASEKGDVLSPIDLNLNNFYILVIFPNISVSTQEAYQDIIPHERKESLWSIIQLPLSEWKHYLTNDFERSVFKKYPIIENIKNSLYKNGAIYASMSGSGSAVYGIFETEPQIKEYEKYQLYLSRPVN